MKAPVQKSVPVGQVAKVAIKALKWVVAAGPLLYEGVIWVKKIIKELKKKKPSEPVKP
jgi:hypothetical protein